MRYFLLDRVTSHAPGVSATGIKNVTLSDQVLHDHFPDYPVFPLGMDIDLVVTDPNGYSFTATNRYNGFEVFIFDPTVSGNYHFAVYPTSWPDNSNDVWMALAVQGI